MPTLNNNHMTTQMRAVWKGTKRPGTIKAAIKSYFAEAVLQETQSRNFFAPTHHVNMTVADTFEWAGSEDERTTKLTPLMSEMKHNPSITVNFSSLSKKLPTVFNAHTLNEFADYLVEHGLVPDDVTVALSPYNETGRSAENALNLVFVFEREVYGDEAGELGDARFTPVTSEDIEDEYSEVFASDVNDAALQAKTARIAAPPTVKLNPLELLR